MPITRADLIGRIRRRSDQSDGNFVTDDEFGEIINEGLSELYDVVIGSHQDYEILTHSITGDGTNTYSLPADFYKERGMDETTSNSGSLTVFPFEFLERNEWQYDTAPGTGDTFTLWYWPTCKQLYEPNDTIPKWVVAGWERAIVYYACAEVAAKEESLQQAQLFEQKKQMVYMKIRSAASERIKGEPSRIVNVRKIRKRQDRLASNFRYQILGDNIRLINVYPWYNI